jgi:ABC-type glutathione transport system ATPase component
MVYVSHAAAGMRPIADHVIVLDRGQIVLSGEPSQVLEKHDGRH